jgi:ferredoxin
LLFGEFVILFIYKMYGGALIMAYVISDECIGCGSCEGACPVEAIAEGDGKYVIDADKCISCGACAAGCPVDAISE